MIKRESLSLIYGAVLAGLSLLVPHTVSAQHTLGGGPTLGAPTSALLPDPNHPGTSIGVVHIGDIITISNLEVSTTGNTCAVTNGVGFIYYPDNTSALAITNFFLPAGPLASPKPDTGGVIDCPGTRTVGTLGTCTLTPGQQTWVVKFSDINKPITASIDLVSCSFPALPQEVQIAGIAKGDQPVCSNPGSARGCGGGAFLVLFPCISITKVCDSTCPPPFTNSAPYNANLSFHGTVSNCSDTNTTLFNLQITDGRPGAVINVSTQTVMGFPFDPGVSNINNQLRPGDSVNYVGTFPPAGNLCGPFTNTISVTAQDITGLVLSNTSPQISPINGTTNFPSPTVAVCTVCTTPQITVTKQCPATNVFPGGVLGFSGIVSNAGNVPLTNVLVFNNQPSNSTLVYGPVTLAVGESRNFAGSYTVPLDSCGPYTDTLTAYGAGLCSGLIVSNMDTKMCPGTNSPSIAVTKNCPAGLLQPGQTNVVTGTVTNTGNITLTNVTITNIIAALGTNRQILGPITLAPGAGTNFTDNYVIPLDSCGPYADTVVAAGADKCFGRIVTNSFTAFCPGTNSPSIVVTKSCPAGLLQPGQTNMITGTVTNTGNITLTNVTVINAIAALGTNHFVLGPLTLAPGTGTNFTDSYIIPLDSCGPYADTVTATGADKCFGNRVTNTFTAFCPGTNSPSIVVTKSCPQGLLQPGQTNVITGTVTNTGNITLTNVTVTNAIAALGTSHFLLGPVMLAPGAGMAFSDSYVIPLDSCGPYGDTVTAFANDKCFGRRITNSFTVFCPGTNSPNIAVSKFCPANPVPPGGTLVITGFVTNTGNITLTNITVTNVIAAIGQSHLILGPISLPPGGVAPFTDQYLTPLDSCGPYRDTVIARGADKCFGRVVTASTFRDCPGITTPKIVVVKHCPVVPVPPNGVAVFSGTVSNAGNITLTNVIVVNDRPTNNTPVFGPVTLAPGQSTNFTGSEVVPPNCCSYFDTLLATGASICTGSNVTSSSTAVCPTLTIPRIAINKNCPPNPVPLGQPLVFTGTVSNTGNITLIGVTVVDSKPTNNTPVLGPITLAPGESANFAGSYLVPINICDTNISDVVSVVGTDVCSGSNVTATAGAICPIMPMPRLAVTKKCPPNPVAPGDLLVYTGTVSNAGTITITNIFVVNDRPAPNTPVLGPITLTPGQSVGFSGSYIAPYDCCGPCVDTLTAHGNEFCAGSNVVADASAACPLITTPRIAVTRDCPLLPVSEGDLTFFSGSVSNSGNATLGNVSVVDDQAGVVLANIALAPGEAVPFTGMYIPTNCGPNVSDSILAMANDVCTGVVVSNRFIVNCSIGCPTTGPVTITAPRVSEHLFQFSFGTESGHGYTVQFTDLLLPVGWQTLTNFPGDGNVATIRDGITNNHRFYRVVTQ